MNSMGVLQGQPQYQSGLGGQLDLRTATAGQLQDAARRRHAEVSEKRAKLLEEASAMLNELDLLEEMLPKGGEK
jgi:hypothetical protein